VQNGSLFRAGWVAPTDTTAAKGTLICLNNGNLFFNNNNNQWRIASNVADDSWHHFVMTINRTYNNVALYLDGRLLQNFDADQLGAVSGDMFLGGDGFEGNIDEFTIFEQALPQSLMTSYGSISPTGEEMGLMAYLPFSEMKENESGILEQVFSVNDQRVFAVSSIKLDRNTLLEIIHYKIRIPDDSVLRNLLMPYSKNTLLRVLDKLHPKPSTTIANIMFTMPVDARDQLSAYLLP
jgi:hypothetical protein